MIMCSNTVMFEVISCVHPLSGMEMLGEESLHMVNRVCLVLVKMRVFLVGVHPESVGELNCTVLCAMTGMCVSSGDDATCVLTGDGNGTTVVAILSTTKVEEGKYKATELLLKVKLW